MDLAAYQHTRLQLVSNSVRFVCIMWNSTPAFATSWPIWVHYLGYRYFNSSVYTQV